MYETKIKINGKKEVSIKTNSYKEASLVYQGASEMIGNDWTRYHAVNGAIKFSNSIFDLYEQGCLTVGEITPTGSVLPGMPGVVPTTKFSAPEDFQMSPAYAFIMQASETFPILLPGIIAIVLSETIFNDEHILKEMREMPLKAKVNYKDPIERTKEVISFLRSLLLQQPDGGAKWEMVRDILGGKLHTYEAL